MTCEHSQSTADLFLVVVELDTEDQKNRTGANWLHASFVSGLRAMRTSFDWGSCGSRATGAGSKYRWSLAKVGSQGTVLRGRSFQHVRTTVESEISHLSGDFFSPRTSPRWHVAEVNRRNVVAVVRNTRSTSFC